MSHTTLASVFSPSDLPDGFSYPASFLEFLAGPTEDLYPWAFIDPTSDHGRSILQIASAQEMVPFASNDLTDGDTACFRTHPFTREPEVLMLILDSSDRSYSFSAFGDWLHQAREDAANSRMLGEVRFDGWEEIKRIEQQGTATVFIQNVDERVQYILFRFVERTWQSPYRSGSFLSLDDAMNDAQLNKL